MNEPTSEELICRLTGIVEQLAARVAELEFFLNAAPQADARPTVH
jgi:hypothetical protein